MDSFFHKIFWTLVCFSREGNMIFMYYVISWCFICQSITFSIRSQIKLWFVWTLLELILGILNIHSLQRDINLILTFIDFKVISDIFNALKTMNILVVPYINFWITITIDIISKLISRSSIKKSGVHEIIRRHGGILDNLHKNAPWSKYMNWW